VADANAKKLLEELIQLEGLRNPNHAAGKRQFTRHVVRSEAEFVPMDRRRLEQVPSLVQLRDLGRGGLGIVAPRQFEVDSLWRVNFIQHGLVVGEISALARHCRSVSGGIYLTGFQFCADSGLLSLLGIDQKALMVDESNDVLGDADMFVAPSEVA